MHWYNLCRWNAPSSPPGMALTFIQSSGGITGQIIMIRPGEIQDNKTNHAGFHVEAGKSGNPIRSALDRLATIGALAIPGLGPSRTPTTTTGPNNKNHGVRAATPGKIAAETRGILK